MISMQTAISLAIILHATFLHASTDDTQTIIETKSGQIQGKIVTHDNEHVFQFLGIPFAKPPLGKLRFSKPQPVEPWKDTLEVMDHPPLCIAKSQNVNSPDMSEDCLYLSIYVPFQIEHPDSKAAIVFVQGEGQIFDQPSAFDGSHLAINGDVIVVTVNYRLNIFGFLSGHSEIKGNFGLWDQRLAFEWVKENIGDFGGNPSFITIFGESSGGATVSLQSLIPQNDGLFQRAISHNGMALSPFAMSKDTANTISSLQEVLGCRGTDTAIVECFREKPAEDLLKAAHNIAENKWKNSKPISAFAPCVDGELIVDEPRRILSDKSSEAYRFFRSLGVIIGTNKRDPSFINLISSLLDIDFGTGSSSSIACNKVSQSLAAVYFGNSSEVQKSICEFYETTDTDEQNTKHVRLIEMITDFAFNVPAVEMLNIHAENNAHRTYQYVFSRFANNSLSDPDVDWATGDSFGTELINILHIHVLAENMNITVTDDDYLLSEQMVLFLGNFAKSGNLNSASLPHWPQYVTSGEGSKTYIDLNMDITLGNNYHADSVKFWLEDIPNLLKPKQHTHDEL